ncbi:unnamed protein product [Allacma fusca]|uniref:Uncharacterized protein n=1 Tax=Allacma fusca TaxID=39272 RepID=A0A8J2PNI7_9HEXA|nr:unnamed protein product [Allacma fusca]
MGLNKNIVFHASTALSIFLVITFKSLVHSKILPRTPFDLIAMSQSSAKFDTICQSTLLATIGKSSFTHFYVNLSEPYVLLNLNTLGSLEPKSNQSYFYKELHADDMLHPNHFSSYHFIPQCSVAFLEVDLYEDFQRLLEVILDKKLVKSYRDHFIFYHESQQVLTEFLSSEVASNIAFKYGISSILSQTHDPEYATINPCSSTEHYSKNLQLYREDCKIAINGKTITVAAVAGAQFGSFENNEDGSLKKARGIYFLMLQDCSKRMNFTIRMFRSPGSGSKKNGIWSGGIGELFSRRADVSFPISIIEPRNAVIDCSPLLEWFEKVFWVKAPPVRTTAHAILKPFTKLTWMSILLSVVGCIPVFFVFIKKNFTSSDETHHPRNATIVIVLDIVTRLLLEQSTALRGYMGSRIRFTIIVWAVFSLIMGTGYRSKLFFFLTFLESDSVPRTHKELAYSNYKLYFRTYGGVAYRYMIKSSDPVHQAMVRDNRLNLEETTVGCIKRVFVEENVACMDYGFSGDYTIFTNATLFAEADPKASKLFKRSVDVDGRFMIIWAFRKYSPLAGIFSRVIRWMMCSGMYDRWVHDDWNEGKRQGIHYLKSGGSVMKKKLEQIEQDLNGGPKPLTQRSLAVPFFSLIALNCASAIFLGLEIILKRSYPCFQYTKELKISVIFFFLLN